MKKSMKKMVATSLCFAMVMPFSGIAFATTPVDDQAMAEKSANIVEQVVGTDEIVGEISETATNFKTTIDNTKTMIPKKGSKKIETKNENGDLIGMTLPEEVSASEGVKTNNGTIVYDSETENIDVTVQALEEEIDNIIYSSIRTMVTIEDASAPKRFDFRFDLPEGSRLITSSDYARLYYPENNDWIGDNLVFIIDKENSIVSTIDEAWAKDGNGDAVATYYEISGSILTQVINFNENSVFPIIADPTNTGAKTKIETLAFANTSANRSKLVTARRQVNARQNSTLATVISFVNSIFGLFSVYTGVTSMIISGVIGGNSAYLEKCEDAYSYVQEELNGNRKYKGGEIDFSYAGTYQGKNKGYVYQAKDVKRRIIK